MAYEVHNGYQKFKDNEPLILEPENWSFDEWATICKLCGLPLGQTERIVLHTSEVECFVDLSKKAVDGERTNTVTEVCPHCESEIEMRWDTDTMGFKAFCPVCGERLMLCDECRHAEEPSPCDYGVSGDGCWRSPSKPATMETLYDLRVETPLGAIIARVADDPEHPGIWIDLRRPGVGQDMQLAMVEFSQDDSDLQKGEPNLITRVWADGMKEFYTDRIIHRGIKVVP